MGMHMMRPSNTGLSVHAECKGFVTSCLGCAQKIAKEPKNRDKHAENIMMVLKNGDKRADNFATVPEDRDRCAQNFAEEPKNRDKRTENFVKVPKNRERGHRDSYRCRNIVTSACRKIVSR